MFYYFKKGKNTTEMQKKICSVYEEGAMNNQTCQKWFVMFCAGVFPLHNVPRSGISVEVDSNQIKTFDNNQ